MLAYAVQFLYRRVPNLKGASGHLPQESVGSYPVLHAQCRNVVVRDWPGHRVQGACASNGL